MYTIADSALGLALTYYGLESVAWADPLARLDLVQQFITTYGPQTLQYLGQGSNIDVKGLVQDVIIPAIWSMGSGMIAKYLVSAAPGFVLHWRGAAVGATEAELIAATAVTAFSLGYALETGSEPGRLCSNFFQGPPLFQPGGTPPPQSSIVSGRRIIYAASDWDIPASRAGVIAGV